MVKRAPSGPGWKRFLLAGRQRRFLLVLLPKWGCPAPRCARRLPPGRCLSWGLLRAPARDARQLGYSWARAPRSRLPAGAVRISCRGSRAPGAAPSDRTTCAGGAAAAAAL